MFAAILYTTDRDGNFLHPGTQGFKIWLWFWWWMCFSKSQIVAVLKCMIYISQPSWYFFTHFSWKIPGYLSPLSELLTPLDSGVLTEADWSTQDARLDQSRMRFETKHWTWLQTCHCSVLAHLNQKTIDTGKCHQQLGAVRCNHHHHLHHNQNPRHNLRSQRLPCYYFKYNFQTGPGFKWIRAKFLRLSFGHKHRVIHFHFYTKKPRYPFLLPLSLSPSL